MQSSASSGIANFIPRAILCVIFLLIILTSCTTQKNIVKKGEKLDKKLLLHSLEADKTYRFWYAGGLSNDKVKITSVDSAGVTGVYKNYNKNRQSTTFELTPDEILNTFTKVTRIKFNPVLTVLLVGLGGLILIIPTVADPGGMSL